MMSITNADKKRQDQNPVRPTDHLINIKKQRKIRCFSFDTLSNEIGNDQSKHNKQSRKHDSYPYEE